MGLHQAGNCDTFVLCGNSAQGVSAFGVVVGVGRCNSGYGDASKGSESGHACFHGAHAATATLNLLGFDPLTASRVHHNSSSGVDDIRSK